MAEPFIIERPAPQFIDFAEVKLELGYDYGVVGGPEFKTEVIEVSDGREQRNVQRHLPLGRWQLGERSIAESEVNKLAEVSYLKQFHEDRRGAKQGFRFKDWSDYRAVNQLIAIGDGITRAWQLRKSYHAGNAITYRPIQKPVVGTVDVFVDGVNVGENLNHQWEIDHDTGILSHPQPLPNGEVLTSNFEFDVPVWFESDQISFELDYYDPNTDEQMYKLGNVFVIEQRLPLLLPWGINASAEIDEPLNLGIVYQTLEKFEYSTRKIALDNGFTLRHSNRHEKRILFDYGDRTFNQAELDILLGYFWNARGKAGEFTIVDKGDQYIVRFNADRLNIKFIAADDNDALFKVTGLKLQLKLQLKEKVIYKLPPFSLPLEPIFINLEDPEDPNTQSSGNSRYTGSAAGGGGGNAVAYTVSSFNAHGVGFSQLPPGDISSNVTYRAVSFFWAGGSLNLLVSASNGNYQGRLVHYRVNPETGWTFEYQAASSEALRNYIVTSTDINFPRIYRRGGGVAQYFRANNTIPFGSTEYTPLTTGTLRFQINDNGSFEVRYFELPTTYTQVPLAVYGDRLLVSQRGAFTQLGVFDGDRYYNNASVNNVSGYPFSVSNLEDFSYNIWRNQTEPDLSHNIYHGNDEILKYFPRVNSPPNFYIKNGEDGSYLIQALARYVCETNSYGCSTEDSLDLVYFFLKRSYDAEPILIDTQRWIQGSPQGDAHYIQTYSSGKITCDQYGNMIAIAGFRGTYYRAGSGKVVNIINQLGVSSHTIRGKPSVTPYGFALIAHVGNLFTQPVKLMFVQSN